MPVSADDFDKLLDAADEVLSERERIQTPAGARLALLIVSHKPDWVQSADNCTLCDAEEREDCPECPPTKAGVIAALTKLAERVPSGHEN